MNLKQEEVAPKKYKRVRVGPLYREKKKKFQDWVRVEGRYLWMRNLKDLRLYYVTRKTDGGREFQSLEIIGINELAIVFVRLVGT